VFTISGTIEREIKKYCFSTKKRSDIIKKSSYIHRLFRDSAGVILLAVSVSGAFAQGESNGQPFNNLQSQIDSLQSQIDALLVNGGMPLAMDVNCSNGETIAGAINSVSMISPLTLTVHGTCNENLLITRSNLTLRGSSQSDGIAGTYIAVLASRSASNIVVENMTVRGSFAAIGCIDSAAVLVSNAVLRDSARGVLAFDGGSCRVDNTKVLDNVQGVTVGRNANLTIRGGDLLNNYIGANVFSGGSLAFEASLSIPGKRTQIKGINTGVNVYNNGSLALQAVDIEGHTGAGVTIRFGGVVHTESNDSAKISNNGRGILIGELGILRVVSSTNFSIQNNAGYGVSCVPGSPFVLSNTQLISFSGNSLSDIDPSCFN